MGVVLIDTPLKEGRRKGKGEDRRGGVEIRIFTVGHKDSHHVVSCSSTAWRRRRRGQ